MLLKGEVEGHAFNIMEITLLIMENHGKIMELCFLISVGTLIGLDIQASLVKIVIDLFTHQLEHVLWVTEKHHHITTVLLSTNNICLAEKQINFFFIMHSYLKALKYLHNFRTFFIP